MKSIKKALSVLLMAAMLVSMCASGFTVGAAVGEKNKEVVIYFANWNVYDEKPGGQVKDLPWDRVSYINHAFWEIKPENGKYGIVSTDPWADTDEYNPDAHFPQYEEYTAKYPNVNVLISVGGWTRCGYFSEMALTAASRKTFIDSCIETLKAYPWLAGIDIDWEYPGVARTGSGSDQGNPVKGDDFNNYTALLKEMRQAFDAEFGVGAKKLTVCSSVGVATIAKQDVAAFAPYVDLINIMSYDMTASYDRVTGHHAALFNSNPNGFSTEKGVMYYLNKGVPASKINIGTPLYCHGWGGVKPDANGNLVGVSGSSRGYAGDMNWNVLKDFEKAAVPMGTPGWHMGYDTTAEAAYLYNDDTASKYNGNFLTYESSRSLQAKLDFINTMGLAGLIVWESYGDSAADDYPMITQMAKSMGVNNQTSGTENELVMKANSDYAVLNGTYGHTTQYGDKYAQLSIVNGTSMLPLRYLAEVNGLIVDYNDTTSQTKVTNPKTGEYLMITPGSNIVSKYSGSGTLISSSTAPAQLTLMNGITMAPLRFICEALGLSVSYNELPTGNYVVVTTVQKTSSEITSLINSAINLGL